MVKDCVIRVAGIGKQYRIGAKRVRFNTLRESLTAALTGSFRRLTTPGNGLDNNDRVETIWALKDVSFEVKEGEVLGVIGRNGAGKSTLLKILSRITEPTEGSVVIRGRVGSLLEVGTGFHSELTGRENIYLNGAILGMKKEEIARKFEEIVDFAEVDKFIDTPVKHYSSGMYMRLAFSVAAHLETEILLVDEVLAVGDAAFQKKCLGKMGDVAEQGRTVLFVSHNMQAVQSLCGRVILLEEGRIAVSGDPRSVVARYLAAAGGMGHEATWPEQSAPGNQEIRLLAIRVSTVDGVPTGSYSSNKEVHVELEFMVYATHTSLCVGFDLVNAEGIIVARSYQTDLPPEQWPQIQIGENRWRCIIPDGLLNAGLYYVCPRVGMHNLYWIVHLEAQVRFEVVLDHGVSPFWNALDGRNRPGVIAPIFKWAVVSEK
jgi:lipopolysaccharide transport system ATP-binding protein